MKTRAGQAGRICLEAAHQLGRIAMLLFMLVLAALGLFAYSLSRHPMEIPHLASWLATTASGDGITVRMEKAELAWAGYSQGGGVPLVLRLSDIEVHNAAGVLLVEIPKADFVVPPTDLFGGREAILLLASAARLSDRATSAIQAPITVRAKIWPGAGYSLARGAFFVSIGPGMLGAKGVGVPITSAGFTLRTAPGAVDISDGAITLTPVGASTPHGSFTFTARRTQNWAGSLRATIDTVHAEDLGQYWPEPALTLTRAWVVNHITTGTAGNADFTFTLAAPGDLSSLRLTDAVGGFDATGLTLYWLSNGMPITGLNGRFAMPNADEIVITSSAGMQGNVTIRTGTMDITGVSHKDQTGVLTMGVAGDVPAVLAVLNAPPLHLLAHTPPELGAATGDAEGQLNITIPFKKDLVLDDVTLAVTANVHNLVLPNILPPLGARNGEVQVQSDGHSLHLQAKGEFAGEPASLMLNEDFTGTGTVDLAMKGEAGHQIWHLLGMDNATALNGPAGGTAPFTIHLTGTAMGAQTALLRADLTPVALSLPVFAWDKKTGIAGDFALTAQLRNGAFESVQNFAAHAPGLSLEGVQQGGGLAFSAINIGRTQASGTLTWPATADDAWTLSFSGPVLDIRQPKPSHEAPGKAPNATAPAPSPPPPSVPPSGPRWKTQLSFDQLYLADPPAPAAQKFTLAANGRGATVLLARGAAQGLDFSITPKTISSQALLLHATDAGSLLRVLGEYDHLQGGNLELKAVYGGGQPITGKAILLEARFVDAPDVTKLLEGLTLYGLADAASGPGLMISRTEIPFTYENDVLLLHGARAHSSSLGFTASGSINLAANSCDLDTTIVPLYALNALPGKIPLIGRLFSAEKGGGLLAMRAHISGPIGHAKIDINPLSALTPGFLRGIFGLGEALKK